MLLTSKPDAFMVADLSPLAVAGYLESKGWARKHSYGQYGAIFNRTRGEHSEELIMSTSKEAKDYAKVMSLFVVELADIESRSPHDLLSDLSIAPYDVIRVRTPDADEKGTVRLVLGLELHEQAKDAVLAAANAAASPAPRPIWRGRPFERVDAYIRAVRLGQSQRGSFVLSLLSPWDFVVPVADGPQLLFPVEAPFGRQVTLCLARALGSIRQAIDRSVNEGITAAFSPCVPDGVSSNLCDALAAMARESDGIEVSVNWSLTKPEKGSSILRLSREDAQTLTEASRSFVKDELFPDIKIEGIVLQLNNDIETFDGAVVILGTVNGMVRRVKVKFSERDRQKVFEAGQAKLAVSVIGDLEPGGRAIVNPRDLTVFQPLE